MLKDDAGRSCAGANAIHSCFRHTLVAIMQRLAITIRDIKEFVKNRLVSLLQICNTTLSPMPHEVAA